MAKCKECKGEGRVVLFTSSEPCGACGGTGYEKVGDLLFFNETVVNMEGWSLLTSLRTVMEDAKEDEQCRGR